MKFFKWIDKHGGPRKVAQALGTESPTVRAWVSGISTPQAAMMQRLVKMGHGAFSYEDIVLDTIKAKKAARR